MKNLPILIGFLPWVLFFLLFGNSVITKEIATGVALTSHIVINWRTIRKFFVLDIGTLVFFLLFAMNLVIFKYPVIINNGYLISNLALSLIAWGSLIIKRPFTLQYANLTVTEEIKYSKLFVGINYILTFIWAILLTLMLVPSILQNYIPLEYNSSINMATSIFLVAIGIFFTNKFPDWFSEKVMAKRFNLDIKKIFRDRSTNTIDFTNFNVKNIVQVCDIFTEVIIVGAGPIGLASALLLQQFGINVVVVEKHKSTSIHPKARAISCRSMELFRRIGIEQHIQEYSLPKSQSWIGWFLVLTGKVYAKIVKKTDYESISPSDESNVAQTYLEKIMLTQLQRRGGEALFQHQLVEFAQNSEYVQVKVENKNTMERKILQGKYMIAADGAHSTIRQYLNIPMLGIDEMNVVFSVYCEINLEHILSRDKYFNIAFILNSDGPSPMVLSIDGKNKWMFIFPSPGVDAVKLNEIYTDEYTLGKIRAIIGVDDDNLPIHVISKQAWSLGSQIANQIRAGRIFLAGDSIHRFVPTGGMGMNTGLQDVDNLVWKLAFVLQGYADPNILDSYEEERIPSILDNMAWSISNLQRIVTFQKNFRENGIEHADFEKLVKEQNKHLNKSGLDLGTIYQSSIIAKSNITKPNIRSDQYIPTTYPGARLPHFELRHNGKIISSLDLIVDKFLFLCWEHGNSYFDKINFELLPTEKICLNAKVGMYEVDTKKIQELLHLGDFDAIWVRPDGHIAWMGCLTLVSDIKQLEEIINHIKQKTCMLSSVSTMSKCLPGDSMV